MRICMIGKFPPIEGGVSMHQYWYAHSLASLGHQIHVVTNAKEVELPFHMFMRQDDWLRCEAQYPSGGYVRVHWSDPYNNKQRHIPSNNPFVTKLASIAAQVVQEHDLQVIFSYYLEPYGVAGYLAAQMTGRPHVVKHAGSDLGRLHLHPQFGPLYDHIFRSATRVISGRNTVQQLRRIGLDEGQLFLRDDFRLPETLFCPQGTTLDLEHLLTEVAQDPHLASLLMGNTTPRPPFLGVYGKLGEVKGTFDLLNALKRLKQHGQTASLLVVGHAWGPSEVKFRQAVAELGLTDCVTQLPFLPHWRIPEFIRLCHVICFLERDFPISFHAPTVPREVLACAGCLVGSAEILHRQPFSERLIHGFNCLVVRDVHDTQELASKIAVALENPERAKQVGQRAHQYSVETEALRLFPWNYEALLTEVIEEHSEKRQRGSVKKSWAADKFSWTHQVVESLPPDKRKAVTDFAGQYRTAAAWAFGVYAKLLELVESGELDRGVFIEAVRLELRIAGILNRNGKASSAAESNDGLFRLTEDDEILLDDELLNLRPSKVPDLEVEEYEYDVSELLAARNKGEFPLGASRRSSCAAIIPNRAGDRTRILVLSPVTNQLLDLCDGSRTVEEIATGFCEEFDPSPDMRETITEALIEGFRLGLIRLSR